MAQPICSDASANPVRVNGYLALVVGMAAGFAFLFGLFLALGL